MLSNRRLVALCAMAFCCNISLLVLYVKYYTGDRCFVTIDKQQKVINVLPDDFLGFGIDASEIESYDRVDFMKPRFQELAAALAPARFRLGGTKSDCLIFSKNDHSISHDYCNKHSQNKSVCSAIRKQKKTLPYFIMTGNKWNEINKFSNATNVTILFPLNVMIRDHQGWNAQNAKELIEYSYKKHYNLDWQLGNEPNSFPHVFNTSIPPETLAKDFKKLREILNHYGYKHSLLVGPDTTRPQPHRPECIKYMEEFLGNGSEYINVRSWHQYYLNSRSTNLEDFWNPDTFDLLKEQIFTMKSHTSGYSHIPMWLTETSSAYGGGAPGLSDSYAGSPLWIDKLGLSAKYNITTVIRQSFYGGNYSLISKDLEPLPDWWLSVLYKKLVGNKVLNIKCDCSQFQRMYAHCANRQYTNDITAITIYAINLQMGKVRFLLNGTALNGDNINIDEYIISAPSNNRKTKQILLNSWALQYPSSLVDLKPRHIKNAKHISMPPYSIAFWVIRDTSLKVCQ